MTKLYRCQYCGNHMWPQASSMRNRVSKDHILPKAYGFSAVEETWITHRRFRRVCMQCNQDRAVLNHCPAVLQILLQVGQSLPQPIGPITLAKRWGVIPYSKAEVRSGRAWRITGGEPAFFVTEREK